MKAIYVSCWEDGIEVMTACEFDPETNVVSEIEASDIEGLEFLDLEFIILPNGSVIERENFKIEGEDEEATPETIEGLKKIFQK